jgi:quercetin dioxygenase-like cupin family protein
MRNKRKMTFAAIAVAIVIAGVTLVSGALATNPGGVVPTLIGSGTSSGPFKYSVPKVVTVTQKIRVKTKSGKYVTRTKRIKRTIDNPIVTCNATTPCDMVQQKLTFQPGGFSGWHSHPGVVLIIVTAGTLTRYDSTCTKTTIAAGQTFIELAPDGAAFVRNDGSTPAEAVQTYINPTGAALRTDQPAPSGCNP